ncbi:unnamed protein product [Caenorhabditis auriculariae]|uniref:DUF4604 domain-containing protein n=1 Tax=Caenorhabditis auriculariae TaxID=2777116 RepID=A0A8S1GQ10_9PELO|nr:unnamed protein product [Caenorhabditis auriculariae]
MLFARGLRCTIPTRTAVKALEFTTKISVIMPGKGGKGGGKLTYNQKAGISFVEQDEPDFIKEMKAKLGYREPAKLEDKFEEEAGPGDIDDDETELMRLKEEDRPQVVVLDESTDLSKEELHKELAAKKKEEDDKLISEGKIKFKKPVKRNAEGNPEPEDEKEKKKRKEENKDKKVERSLLSFGDDEEDE